MYFNPRIEAWLYKVTNTTSPEYKSELHATNGKSNGYSQIPNDAEDESKTGDNKGEAEEEKVDDAEKGTTEEEKGNEEQNKEEEDSKDRRGFHGNNFSVIFLFF